MHICEKALITTVEGAHGAEGSVTPALMWAYDNAAWADIDAEEAINGAVSPVERLPRRWGRAEVSAGTGRVGERRLE